MKKSRKTGILFFFGFYAIFSVGTLQAQIQWKIGDSVEVINIGKGIIVGGYQKTEWNYSTYQVHMNGEKWCNNHVLDTRYSEASLAPIKQETKLPPSPKNVEEGKVKPTVPSKQTGDFLAGDTVLYTQTSLWQKGVIKEYDPVNRRYSLRDVYVDIPCHSVAKPATAYNNDFFVGLWNVSLSGANYTTVEKGKVIDNISSGMKLFPLQVKKDGSYSWKVSAGKTITGRWQPRTDAPGIVIFNGIDGKNWTVYETTEGFATTKNTKDEIRFHDKASNSGYYLATRIGSNKSCLLKGRTFKN